MEDNNKREEILRQAEICFGNRGINQTKLQDIASELRISKKTIYKYFSGKEELIKTVYAQKAVTMNREASCLAENDKICFTEKLIMILKLIKTQLYYITPAVVADLKTNGSEIKSVMNAYIKHAVFERFIGLLEQASKNGDLKESVHIQATGLLYRDALMSFLLMHHQVNIPKHIKLNLRPVDILVSTLIIIFKGILKTESIDKFESLLIENDIIVKTQ
ncbi:MAG: TetR/AcrR family transcriptional regulator [Cyclobacteriaceae bacterium]